MGETATKWARGAALIGGLLWVPYSLFEMWEPWGPATAYQEDLGYQLIIDTPLFIGYSLPGAVGLLFTSLGLLGITRLRKLSTTHVGRAALILARVSVGVAVLTVAGVLVLFAPLFFGGLVFGSLALGVATFLQGLNARSPEGPPLWSGSLLLLGLMGILMLPVRPLVYALGFVPNWAGATFIGLFGLCWVGIGLVRWPTSADGSALHEGTF